MHSQGNFNKKLSNMRQGIRDSSIHPSFSTTKRSQDHCTFFTTHSPTVLCQRLTANNRLHVTVTAAGMLRWGSVLAATWVTGELEGNLSTMMTSCCIWSLNISGLWGRKHWWDRQRNVEGRIGEEEGQGMETEEEGKMEQGREKVH